MLKAEAQLEAEIAALLRKAELIDAQKDKRYGKGKRGDELPKELQQRQDRIQVLRKARAELEAEAAADHARQRERKARCADRQAAAAQASAAAATAQADANTKVETAAKITAKAARRARAARQRPEAAKALALQKAEAAGQPIPDLEPQSDPQAMPSRNLPTNAAGEVKGKAQRNYRFAGLRLHRSRQPRPQRRRRLDPGLELPGGGRWRPPGDRGSWDQQPGQ
jgi:hypothetical protein